MAFLWHEGLWLLVIAPLLATTYVVMQRRRKTPTWLYSSLLTMRAGQNGARPWRRHIPPALIWLALIILIVSIARPATNLALPHQQRAVILAIDVSYSMGATDMGGTTRLAAAQAAARAFVQAQPRDVRIGVVAFAGEADVVQVPTLDRQSTLAAIEQLDLDYNTAIGSGLIAALHTLFPASMIGDNYDIFGRGHIPSVEGIWFRAYKKEPAHSVPPGSDTSAAIIVLTDGRTTMGPDPLKAAQLAAQRGIRVYTVGFGSTAGSTVEVQGQHLDVNLDEVVLKDIAKRTRAEYFQATTAQELNDIYRTLSGSIVLERRETEIAALLAAVAAILTLTSAGLSLAWSPRMA